MTPIVVFLLLVVVGIALGAIWGRWGGSRTVQNRLDQLGRPGDRPARWAPRADTGRGSAFAAAAAVVSQSGGKGTISQHDYLPFLTHALERRALFDSLKLDLIRAGMRLRPSEFVVALVLSTFFCPIVAFFFTHHPLVLVLAGAFGFMLPFGILKAMQATRLAKFGAQLPDALILIASSIRSGYSFMRAIQVVSDQMADPIAEEFGRVLKETNLGSPTEVAFANMVRRVPSYDLDLVVTAVVIQQQVGGNLAEIMDTIAGTIRERVKLQREIAALTAEGKLSGWICFGMPFFMFGIMTTLNPDYMKPLMTTPQGWMMVWIALALQLMGGAIIKKLLSVDV
jgi:tight adherence protein B